MAVANRTAQWRAAAREASAGLPQFDKPARIVAHIWKPRRGRYDPNNLNITTKACVDGFVDSGVFVDDDWAHVIGPDHRHGGIGPAAIVFSITELTNSMDRTAA